MLKMTARTGDNRTLVVLGLDRENVRLLTEGKPIVADLAELGIPGVIVSLMFGETQDAMLDELRGTGIKVAKVEDRRPQAGGQPAGVGDSVDKAPGD
jgi:hypothetical protein